MNAYDGSGFAYLQRGDAQQAAARFRGALERFPDHARSLVGLGAALAVAGDPAGAAAAFGRATAAIDALRRGGRGGEATLAEAFHHSVAGRPDAALECLRTLLDKAEAAFTGWTIPIEPLFEPLRGSPGFEALLGVLAERAR
jgi:tetratricopeptide (TPR) repeat protein